MATDLIMPQVSTTSRDHFFQPQAQLPPYQQNYQQNFSPNFQQYNFQQTSYAAVAAAAGAAGNSAYTAAAPAAPPSFVTPYNPQISPLSTSNSSPTSPKSHYHTRQVRPLYIPAVLRPTEHPSREMPIKPKRSRTDADSATSTSRGSPDGAIEDGDDEDVDGTRRLLRSSGSFISLPGLGAFGFGRLTRRATNDSGKCLDSALNLDMYPEVSGLPSRGHWKPDAESAICDEPTCKKYFNYFTRRHHCRRCGNIFCDFHSAFEVPLDEHANYNPRGGPSRSCGYCYREFKSWRSRTNSSDLSSDDSAAPSTNGSSNGSTNGHKNGNTHGVTNGNTKATTAATAPTSPVLALLTNRPGAPGAPTVAKVPDIAQSVPGDWNWSTF